MDRRNDADLRGEVLWVENDIVLTVETPNPEDLHLAIKKAFELDAESVRVESSNGSVRLSGTVSSWAEHDAALSAAWAAPGVKDIDNRIEVAY